MVFSDWPNAHDTFARHFCRAENFFVYCQLWWHFMWTMPADTKPNKHKHKIVVASVGEESCKKAAENCQLTFLTFIKVFVFMRDACEQWKSFVLCNWVMRRCREQRWKAFTT